MHDDECITEFNVRLLDITNESFTPREKILEERLVRKVSRSLPKKFGCESYNH